MKSRAEAYTGMLLILPSLIGVLIFVLIPFVDVIRRSFTSAISNEWVGLRNYIAVFQNTAFRLAATNTLRFLIICIPILIVLSLLIGITIHRQTKYGHFLKSAYLMPMAIPVVSIAIIWQVLFDQSGIVNGMLSAVSLPTVNWMNSDAAFWVLVISYIWKNTGYNVVLWLAGLSAIPSSVYEAAKVDGAGEWQMFFRITLPNLRKVSFTITLLSLLNSFKVFREAYLVAGNYPHPSMYLLQHLFQNWYRDLSLDRLSAAATLMALVITVIMLQFKKVLYE